MHVCIYLSSNNFYFINKAIFFCKTFEPLLTFVGNFEMTPDDSFDILEEGLARTFYFNASNTATSVTLLGILLLLGLITYLIYYSVALTPLSNKGFNRVQLNNVYTGR